MAVFNIFKEKEKTDVEISSQAHPFDDDLLDRRELAEALSNIVSNTTSSYVYNINSKYGTGKTFFLKRLNCLLKKKGSISVLYNSWESDLFENPIIPLTQEMLKALDTGVEKRHPKTKGISSKALIQSFAEAATEVISKETIIGNIAYKAYENVNKNNENQPKKEINFLLSQYGQMKETIENFKTALGNITINLEKPLVIIIDELDRCRPDYAIKTLETIKHFFDIDNLVFILAMDRVQIESTVRVLYGNHIEKNSSEYLRKFIDHDFYLPIPEKEKYLSFLCERHLSDIIEPYCGARQLVGFDVKASKVFILEYSLVCNSFDKNFKNNVKKAVMEVFVKYLNFTSVFYGLSLRSQEQLVKKIKIFVASLDIEKDVLLPELIVLFNAAHFFDVGLFDNFVKTSSMTNSIYPTGLAPTTVRETITERGGELNALNVFNESYAGRKLNPLSVWFENVQHCLTRKGTMSIHSLVGDISREQIVKYVSLVLTLGKMEEV